MKFTRNPFVVGLALFAVLFFVGQFLFGPKAYLASRFGQAIQWPIIFVRNLFTRDSLARHLAALTLENQSLRARIEELRASPYKIKIEERNYILASAFSFYSLNFDQKILLAAGQMHNLEPGDVLAAAPGFFTGELINVSTKRSEARTIFDPGWELPVRIGEGRIDALFIGGPTPRLTLISKRKSIFSGEAVYLSSSDFPLGLMLGSVGEITEIKEGLFNEAELDIPYNLSEIKDFYILKAHD